MAHRDDSRLDINDDQPSRSLREAPSQAVALRDLLVAERPQAECTDWKSSDRSIYEVEVEAQGQEKQRRTRLLMLANELDAGTIKHRSQSCMFILDRLRAEALLELQKRAVQSSPVKTLPGPGVDSWLRWACGLQEVQDPATMLELRANFPALERFTCRMEEKYWIPGKRAEVESAPFDHAGKLERREWPSESDEPEVQPKRSCSATAALAQPPPTGAAPAAAHDLADPLEGDPPGLPRDPALEKLRTIFEQPDGAVGFRILGTVIPRYKAVQACGATAGILVLGVTLVAFRSAIAAGASELRSTLFSQGMRTVQDSEIQKELELKLSAVQGGSVQVTVESGVVTLMGQTSSQWESVRAESVASQINGVKAVRNHLQVEVLPPPNRDAAKSAQRKSAKF
jgi:BON domain